MAPMFTGLIETVGRVTAATRRGPSLILRVDLGPAAEGVRPGDSIALSGCCQTVTGLDGTVAAFDTVAESLARTTLGAWRPGTPVNVERSLRLDGRLDGHFVAGHVDGTGEVIESGERGGGWWLGVRAPAACLPEIAPKGSVAIDGVSLTVVDVAGGAFRVTLVPTTLRETTLRHLAPGDRVNLETDLLAKYVRRALGALGAADGVSADARLAAALRQSGYMQDADHG